MAASSRPLLLSRHHTDLSLPPPLSRSSLLYRHRLPLRRSSSSAITACLVSGVPDDFVSTRRSADRREFSALANVLRRIEPLDSSVIGEGVSAAARDSMKRTISTMLGLLPSDQFGVSVRVSGQPLYHLLVSSVITGYTLWNAEYRVSLMKNFERSPKSEGVAVAARSGIEVLGEEIVEGGDGFEMPDVDSSSIKMMHPEIIGDSSTDALSYIRELESQLAAAEKELHDQKKEYIHLEHNKEDDSDLLKYLRSLEPEMVSELSQPSSSEVEEIIQQLVQNIHNRLFNNECSSFSVDSDNGVSGNHEKDVNLRDVIVTTRDYLAKLLFWCMLLGHHLRSLEYRLHLSCFVG